MAEPVATRAPQPREGVRRMKEYHPPVAGRDGLRLDFNENTLACSPRVIEALRKITAAESDALSGARVSRGEGGRVVVCEAGTGIVDQRRG